MRISDWSSDVCSSDLLGQPVAWYNLGNSLRKLDRYALAGNAYRQVLRIDPEHANAWNNLGLSLFELKQYPDAIAAYQQARSEEHTSELQSLMRISYAVFCLKTKKNTNRKPKNKVTQK